MSRLDRAVCSEEEMSMISELRDLLSVYKQNEDLINVGAYVKGSNPKIDLSIQKFPLIEKFLKQRYDQTSNRSAAIQQLSEVLS